MPRPSVPPRLERGRKPRKAPPQPPKGEVRGLVWHTDRPQAILGDRIVEEGDLIDGWEITHIDGRGIEVRKGGKTVLLEPDSPFRKVRKDGGP